VGYINRTVTTLGQLLSSAGYSRQEYGSATYISSSIKRLKLAAAPASSSTVINTKISIFIQAGHAKMILSDT
jgi:hypothetical protein